MTIKSSGGKTGLDVLDAHVHDDFGDGQYENRSGSQTGVYPITLGNRVAGTVRTATYRPEWDVRLGSAHVDGQELVIENGNTTQAIVETPSGLTRGTWYGRFTWGSGGSTGAAFADLMQATDDDRVFLSHTYDGLSRLVAVENGSRTLLLDGSWDGDTAETEWAVDRDPYGVYEVTNDGVSMGTTSHSYVPPLNRFRLRSTTDATIRYDEVRLD